jgi:AsmA protein
VRVGRWILGTVAGVVLLAILTVLVVTVFVDPNRYRGQIERAVADATGQPFKIVGDLQISWYPWLALRMGPARFGQPAAPGEPPLLEWQGARVGAKLIPLTQGELIIDRIRLEGAQFYLRRSADGRANWDEAIQSFKTRRAQVPKTPNTAPGPQIAGFEIRDGGLVYVDEASGRRVRLAAWSLDVGEWKAGATVPVETRVTFRNESIPQEAAARRDAPTKPRGGSKASATPERDRGVPLEVDLRLAGRVHVSDDGNDIDIFGLEATNRVRGGTLPGKGVPVDFQVSRLAARLTPLDIGISELSGRVADVRLTAAIQAGETGADKALYVRGPLSLQTGSVREFLAALAIKAPLPLDKTTFGAMRLSSMWDWTGGTVTVNNIDLQLDETHFTGELRRAAADDAQWTFSLHGDKIGLSRYVAIEDTSEEPFELPVRELRALNMQGELTFEQAWLADAQMKNVRLKVEMADGAVRQTANEAVN